MKFYDGWSDFTRFSIFRLFLVFISGKSMHTIRRFNFAILRIELFFGVRFLNFSNFLFPGCVFDNILTIFSLCFLLF